MNPGDAQLRAQSELQPGESLYWAGTADPRRAAVSALPASLFGIPFAGFALFWINSAYHASHGLSRSPNAFAKSFSIFPVFGLPFLLVGVGMVLAPLWAFLKGRNTVYAVTDKRVLIISGGGNRTVKSCTPADIASVDYRERPDGSGDIVIGTNSQMRTNNSVSQIKVGLYGVSNVKEVARQVLNLHTQQRPA
jgi:Bacterial PH domain